MKFIAFFNYADAGADEDPWEEPHDDPKVKTLKRAEAVARGWAEQFNASLRKGERPRVFIRIEPVANDASAAHAWKKTNAVTVIKKGVGNYDTFVCTNCGITGKRFGLSGDIRTDNKAALYQDCAQVQAKLAKRVREELDQLEALDDDDEC